MQAAQELVDLQILVVPIRREAHRLVGPDQAAEAVRVAAADGMPSGLVDDQAGEVAVLLEKPPQLSISFLVGSGVRRAGCPARCRTVRRHDASKAPSFLIHMSGLFTTRVFLSLKERRL